MIKTLITITTLVVLVAMAMCTPSTPSPLVPVSPLGSIATDFCPLCTRELPSLLKDLNNTEIPTVLNKFCDVLPGDLSTDCKAQVKKLMFAINLGETQLFERYSTYATCTILELCPVDCCESPNMPEQIRLAATGDPSELVVMWATLTDRKTQVQYGSEPFPPQPDFDASQVTIVNGTSHTYSVGGWNGFLHVVHLQGLPPNTKYFYRVGDPDVWHGFSQPDLWFITEDVTKESYTIPVVGDMGATDVSDPTIYRMTHMRQAGEIDMVMHVGDLSYADLDQTLWDSMGRKIEPIAGYVPYMVCPGNHESFEDFSAYKARFAMPWQKSGSNSSLYYSFDYGMSHVLSINTEANDDLVADISPETPQWKFIEQDLAKASLNREKRPWLIVIGHRPFYCSDRHPDADCITDGPYFLKWLEDLFVKYKVDLVITGHRHSYERTKNVYKYENNPEGPVYIVNGASGCKEHIDTNFPDEKDAPEWSASRISKYGFGILTQTRQEMTWKYYDDRTGQVIDQTVMKSRFSTKNE